MPPLPRCLEHDAVARQLRSAESQLKRRDAGTDDAVIVEDIDRDVLDLNDVLVHVDDGFNFDTRHLGDIAQGIISAANAGHRPVVERPALG